MDFFDTYKIQDRSEIMIVMKTFEPPFDYLSDIVNYLKSIDFCGAIVIDQLLHIGNTDERFISVFFDGNQFLKDTFVFKKFDRRSQIRKYICDFLRDDPEAFDLTVLNQSQKRLILKGCYI